MDQEFCIIHVSLFLAPSDIFTRLVLVSKRIAAVLSDGRFIRYYLSNYFSKSIRFDLDEMRDAWTSLRNPDILEFKPYYTDGGVSDIEYFNSFASMWKYNGASYSTHYVEGTASLRKNLKCLSYFGGGTQDPSEFYNSVHHDLLNYKFNLPNIPIKYSKYNLSQLLDTIPFSPLVKGHIPTQTLINENLRLRFELEHHENNHKPGQLDIFYPYEPSQTSTAIVSQIAIARPFYFTGAVKNLMIFFSNTDSTDVSSLADLDRYNDITDFEYARSLHNYLKCKDKPHLRYVEYYGDCSKEFYPVLWVEFPDYLYNHTVIQLHKSYLVRRMFVKLIDIDDRRDDFNLTRMEPNFDITYVLGLGVSVKCPL